MKNIIKINKRGLALSQIAILMFAIFAFAFIFAGSLPVVSATDGSNSTDPVKPEGDDEKEVSEKDIIKMLERLTTICSSTEIVINFNCADAKEVIKKGGTKGEIQKGLKGAGVEEEVATDIVKTPFKDTSLGKVLTANVGSTWKSANAAAAANWGITAGFALAGAYVSVLIVQAAGAGDRNIQNFNDAVVPAAAITIAALIIAGTGPIGVAAAGIAAVVMGVWMVATYQNFSGDTFTFVSNLYQPGTAGSQQDCESCNEFEFGCSEYQCKSLGLNCELVNQGTGKEACIYRGDEGRPPVISPLDSAIADNRNLEYDPLPGSTPGARGVKIINKDSSDGCLSPYTALTLGVETNERAECKIDLERNKNFSSMLSYMAEGKLFTLAHTLPIPSSLTAPQEDLNDLGVSIREDENYEFHIKCSDANGNTNTADYTMQFCVQDGPDTSPPVITDTYYRNGSYVGFNVSQIPTEVYTNKPADCRWDFTDREYEQMQYNMTQCSQNPDDYLVDSTFTYGCMANLFGLRNGESNTYYMRCKDKPWLEGVTGESERRIVSRQSYILTLFGSYPLIIDELTINGKESGADLFDATSTTEGTLKAITSGGANLGKAKCEYSTDNRTFYDFYNKGNTEFSRENVQSNIILDEGSHTYYVKCYDQGGNLAYDQIDFTVTQDVLSPTIVRVYHEQGQLKLRTDEEAQCVYSLDSCNYQFEDGVKLTSVENLEHYVEWNTEYDLYIKCMDQFGNMPLPQNRCSIVARAYE